MRLPVVSPRESSFRGLFPSWDGAAVQFPLPDTGHHCGGETGGLCACEKGLVPRGGDHDLRPFPERMGDGKDECHAKVLRMTASCVLEDTAVLPAMRMQDEYDKQN